MLIVRNQEKTIRLLFQYVGIVLAALLLLNAAAGVSNAQSTNRDHPTPLRSDELKADFSQDDPDYFYSFSAGPGEVIFTLDVKGGGSGGGIPYFHLFNTAGRELGAFDKFASRNSSEKLVKRMSFAKRQTVVMRIKKPIGEGSYRLRISGAVSLANETGTDEGDQPDGRNGRVSLPANGILRIEMNDGSAQEFDLRRVRRAIVKP